ncbi:MAG: D-alanyl-D-alanine carboxypeptidase family protein [Pyrinomonadaceae bacterium]
MKSIKREIILFLTVIFVSVSFGILNASAQPENSPERENVRMAYTLVWNYGSKSQRGWYLYKYLIANTLHTEPAIDTREFAEEVMAWQEANSLPETGVIDEPTLMSFIVFWQSQRIRPVYEANENSLLTASIENFWDSTRPIELRKVDSEAFRAYSEMVVAAKADGANVKFVPGNPANDDSFLKIISSYRSPEYQRSLREKSPGAGRAQIAVRSPHFTGRALDIFVGGEPVSTKDENRSIQTETWAYKWLVKNASRFGFYPYFYEPWHWEYAPKP